MNNTYTESDIKQLNGTSLWRETIKIPKIRSDSTQVGRNRISPSTYRLLATGDADATNGRTYVAVPTNLKLTHQTHRRLNLW